MTTIVGDEAPLLDRLRDGDVDALNAVIEQVGGGLYRLAHGITRSPQEAERIVREVLAALARAEAPLEPGLPLRAWAYREAARAALAARGDQANTPLDPWLPRFLPDGHRAGHRAFVTADWSALSDAQLAGNGARDVVRHTVDALADVDRAILLLADVERFTADDIATVLDLPTVAVKQRLHGLHMALREGVTRVVVPQCYP